MYINISEDRLTYAKLDTGSVGCTAQFTVFR